MVAARSSEALRLMALVARTSSSASVGKIVMPMVSHGKGLPTLSYSRATMYELATHQLHTYL